MTDAIRPNRLPTTITYLAPANPAYRSHNYKKLGS